MTLSSWTWTPRAPRTPRWSWWPPPRRTCPQVSCDWFISHPCALVLSHDWSISLSIHVTPCALFWWSCLQRSWRPRPVTCRWASEAAATATPATASRLARSRWAVIGWASEHWALIGPARHAGHGHRHPHRGLQEPHRAGSRARGRGHLGTGGLYILLNNCLLELSRKLRESYHTIRGGHYY